MFILFWMHFILTHTKILQIRALRKRFIIPVSEEYLFSVGKTPFVKKYLAVSWILKKQNFR